MFSTIINLLFLSIVFCSTPAQANECDVGKGVVIRSQDDFDSRLGNCTSIAGMLSIDGYNLTSLNLSGVIDISEINFISASSLLRDLVVDDLEHISVINMTSSGILSYFRAPKLASIGTGHFSTDFLRSVMLPKLVKVESLIVGGAIASLIVPLLENATRLDISLKRPETLIPDDAFDFPSLRHSKTLKINGSNINSVSVPRLQIVEEMLEVDIYGKIEFPELHGVNNVTIDVKSYNFPALRRISGVFTGRTLQDPFLRFNSLEYIEDISVSGRIVAFSAPNMTYFRRLTIYDDRNTYQIHENLDCSSIEKDVDRVRKANKKCYEDKQCGIFSCKALKAGDQTAEERTDQKVKVGVGLGLGIAAFPLCGVCICFFKKRRDMKAKRRKELMMGNSGTSHNPGQQIQNESQDVQLDNLPPPAFHSPHADDNLPSYSEATRQATATRS